MHQSHCVSTFLPHVFRSRLSGSPPPPPGVPSPLDLFDSSSILLKVCSANG
ncbi:hypothetical protein OROGR_010953 [Orobanche gracilis]